MRSILTSLFLFFLVFSLHGQETDAKKQLRNIPLNIRFISRYPVLQKGEFVCFARIVLLERGWEEVSSPLGIQWIFDDQEKKKHIVKYDKIVTELSDWSLSVESAEPGDDGLEVHLAGMHAYSLEEKTFTLKIFANGTYKLTN